MAALNALDAQPDVPLKIKALLCLASLHAELHQEQVEEVDVGGRVGGWVWSCKFISSFHAEFNLLEFLV